MLNSDLWVERICNSDYFEYVLKVKVPTMTSDTDPEGQSIQYIQSDMNETTQAYKAFNNTLWVSGWSSSKHNTPCGVGYKFTSPIKIYKFYFKAIYSDALRVKNYIIQAMMGLVGWTYYLV